ncbi:MULTISPECIES: hypothetical protein [unclassified Wolbachia]|uniref:hypothetical protein n=1 Tax=unclassified Wolbachia TaxID=2640676 RepID=UPI00222F75F1|nr:hypothetical protein [Wolbachia endosymbiont (group A) of Apoderus coryli]
MSNYSMKESEDDFEVKSGMSGTNHRIINDIEVKIKPKSFESDKEKNAQVKYVHTILDKLIADLNDTFVPKLNDVLKGHQDYMDELYDKIDELKTGTIGGDNIDEWEAPTHSDIL